MSQLNSAFLGEIQNSLESQLYSLDDFEIKQSIQDKTLATVFFRHDPQYFFSICEETKVNAVVEKMGIMLGGTERHLRTSSTESYVRFSPGKFKLTEIEDISLQDCPSRIERWLSYLSRELKNKSKIPPSQTLSKLKEALGEKIVFEHADPTAPLTNEEYAKLDQQLASVLQEVERLKEQFSLSEEQIKKLTSELNEIKSSSKELPSGIWAKIAKNKLVNAIGSLVNSTEGRQLLVEQIKKLLT